jgi:transposase
MSVRIEKEERAERERGMKAYSMDLRQRVYGALERGSIRGTAARFEVSETFIYSLKKRYREAGTLAPRGHRGGQRRRVDEAGSRYLQQVLAEAPDLTLNELCQRYEEKFGQRVSQSARDRALKRLEITRKKRLSAIPSATANGSGDNGRPGQSSSPGFLSKA